jgi:ribosomal protein L11 methyltransferase
VRLTVTVDPALAPLAVAELAELVPGGCREGDAAGRVALDVWVRAGAAPSAEALRADLAARGIAADVRAEPEGDDWRHAMRAFHRPVRVGGRLLVRPPWCPPEPGLLDVVVDPAMAFGTGQHATTRGCLELLVDVPPGSLADLGSGTGVLAVAARRLGHDPVWAFDSDPLAVEATLAAARENGVGLRVARRVVGRDRLPAADAIVANITARVLVPLARELAASPPRHAVLSGIRPQEAAELLAAWRPLGLAEARRIDDEGWTSLRLAAA